MGLSDCIYYSFKRFIKIMHDTFLLRRRYVFGIENLPEEGERFIIISNHQNTGNDPLNFLFAMPFERRMCAMARANLFSIQPLITSFLNWVGMVPAYRFNWEGSQGIENNFASFNKVTTKINQGFPFVIFPEAGHTQGHYIGRFTTGTVRIAFLAAQASGWKEDIKIVPTATHYSNYFDVQTDFIWMLAPAVSLKPYYEEYQSLPSSVMRKLTHQIHDTVQSMMLDEGAEDYKVKDFLRESTLNVSNRSGYTLPQLLNIDKEFIKKLVTHVHYDEIIRLADQYLSQLDRLGIPEHNISTPPSSLRLIAKTMVMLLLLPLWIIFLWPHIICYCLPFAFLRTDRMFTNTYRYVFSTLFIYPLSAIITVMLFSIFSNHWWLAIVWILSWGLTARFAWNYYLQLKDLVGNYSYLMHRSEIPVLQNLRSQIAQLLAL